MTPDWSRLERADAFPGDPSASLGVDHIQTHLSHVFLTGDRVYKFRKDVDLGFVDFSTLARRNADCLNEVELNRRLAPDVYLGIAPLLASGDRLRSGDHLRVGSPGEGLPEDAQTCECCVVMRRLPDGRDALSLLGANALTRAQLERVAGCMARFHARHGLGAPAPFSAEQWRRRILGPVEANLVVLGEGEGPVPAEALTTVARAMTEFAERHAESFDRRRRIGRIVDGHGDLHLQHIFFEHDDDEPLLIDCLEFEPQLREIDAASEVAFLAMDLQYRDRDRLAEGFLAAYAGESDDYDLFRVVDFFIAYRATVRAKVAAIAAADTGIDALQREQATASARRHVALAHRALCEPRVGQLIAVGGVVGTGKSTVAQELGADLGAAVISSDRVRKRVAGLALTDRTHAGTDRGLYTPEAIAHTYEAMLERAHPVLASGRSVVLDATYARVSHRDDVAALASRLGVELHWVETRCAGDVARERLAARARAGTNPSDAGPDFYATSVERFEPHVGEGHLEVVRTDEPDWRDKLHGFAASLHGVAERPEAASGHANELPSRA